MVFFRCMALAGLGALSFSACSPVPNDVSETIGEYFTIKDSIAKAIDNRLGQGDDAFKVIAIRGANYEAGSVLAPDASDRLTRKCIFDRALIGMSPFQDLPTVTLGREFKFGAEVPLSQSIVREITAVGGGIGINRTLKLSLRQMTQELIDRQDAISEIKKNSKCLEGIPADALLIRGKISGVETIESQNHSDANAKVAFLNKDFFKLSYDADRGSFALEDSKEKPKFYIVASITLVQKEPRTLAAAKPAPAPSAAPAPAKPAVPKQAQAQAKAKAEHPSVSAQAAVPKPKSMEKPSPSLADLLEIKIEPPSMRNIYALQKGNSGGGTGDGERNIYILRK